MARKAKPIRVKAVRRNPLARVLAGGKFGPRVVKRADTYKRRPKHRKPPDEGQ